MCVSWALPTWAESLEIAVCEVVSLGMRPRSAHIIQLHKILNEMLPLILDMNLLLFTCNTTNMAENSGWCASWVEHGQPSQYYM